jgi:hypothetical protein
MDLKGTFKGTMKTFNTKMNLRSSYGAVDLVAAMKSGKRKGSETYSANIKANNLNVGALTKQPQMVGFVTMRPTSAVQGSTQKPPALNLTAMW